jgi:hypothetical protein
MPGRPYSLRAGGGTQEHQTGHRLRHRGPLDLEQYNSAPVGEGPACATAVKRQHEPQHIVGDLLTAEISEKQARSIKYQITIAKLPLAKDIDDFVFDDVPVNGQRDSGARSRGGCLPGVSAGLGTKSFDQQ